MSLSEIKKFPDILDEIIKDLRRYHKNDSRLQNSASKLNETYSLYESSINSFCSGLTEETLNDELAHTPLVKLEFILLSCDSIKELMDSNVSDKIIRNIDDIVLKLKSLESHLGVKFYSSYSRSVDASLKSYHVMAKEIKKDAIDNASTSGKILENIQKCINDIDTYSPFVPFIAVVGPSLMGKTQLAFILALIQPIIYFVFSSNESQSVYDNFSYISEEIKTTIELDLKLFSRITVLNLEDICNNNHKYWTLGFLFAIYEISSTVAFNDQFDWMSFYLKLSSITYSALSVSEFQRKKGKSLILYILYF
jgi:hypothetical protein